MKIILWPEFHWWWVDFAKNLKGHNSEPLWTRQLKCWRFSFLIVANKWKISLSSEMVHNESFQKLVNLAWNELYIKRFVSLVRMVMILNDGCHVRDQYKKQSRGIEDIPFFKIPLQILDFLLYPWKLQTKQGFTTRNFTKLCYIPQKF